MIKLMPRIEPTCASYTLSASRAEVDYPMGDYAAATQAQERSKELRRKGEKLAQGVPEEVCAECIGRDACAMLNPELGLSEARIISVRRIGEEEHTRRLLAANRELNPEIPTHEEYIPLSELIITEHGYALEKAS